MKGSGKTLLTLFLITWVVFSSIFFFQYADRYIGKSYFDSYNFKSMMGDFLSDLEKYVLIPFKAEEAKKKVKVTKNEIEYYRNYYGSLTDQIENIREQYEEQIEEAKNEKDSQLKALLEKERDAKIDDITKNFKSDDYVAKKIKKIKNAIIDQYASVYQKNKEDFLSQYKFISYNLKNVKTGETFKSGKTDSPLFEKKYNENTGYFVAHNSITIYPNEISTGDRIIDADTGEAVYVEDSESEFVEEISFDEYDEMFLYTELHIENEPAEFEGVISISQSMLSDDLILENYENFNRSKLIFNIIWITGILALIALFTFTKPTKKLFSQPNKIKTYFSKVPLDVKLFILFMIALIVLFSIQRFGVSVDSSEWLVPFILTLAELFFFISIFLFLAIWTWETINDEDKLIKEIKESFIYRLGTGIVDLFLYKSIAGLVITTLFCIFMVGLGFGWIFYGDTIGFVAFFIGCLGVPIILIFLQQMGYLNRIMKHTKQMAEGHTNSEIEVKGKFPLSSHASNLNKVRNGIQKSLQEQAKSERLKTELITNVSHDLRTPLTSIITYTDLLKNENITEEERKHYIDVIDKKSARLKTLIEDLFEVSKMASGNMEINKERIDLSQLLQQAVGEHEEAFEKERLELRVSLPDQPILAYVDGQKWWRVLDNLIVNALKYSLSGTRVYISLIKQGQEAIFTIKNISSYELTENAEELVERFKRADASRNTEGSGLGLAIVQSIVNLHNGKMSIEVDGDLFKVTVIVEIAPSS